MNSEVKAFLGLSKRGSRRKGAVSGGGGSKLESKLESKFALYWRGVNGPGLVREYIFDEVAEGPMVHEVTDARGRVVSKLILKAEGRKGRKGQKRRRWRFDFAHLDSRVAIEIEGGTWTNGAHSRGKHFAEDCEKYNAAVRSGWRVFRLTGEMITVPMLEQLRSFILTAEAQEPIL